MARRVGWILVCAGALAVLVWYGGTGETGPIGWLNQLQQATLGSYSRKLSFMVLCFGGAVLATPLVGVWLAVTGKSRAETGTAAPVVAAPAPAPRPGAPGWLVLLAVWLGGVVLAWAACLAYEAWDYRQRQGDAASDYLPIRLDRAAGAGDTGRPGGGSHLALQGRLLWDRGVVRQERTGTTERETLFVPVAGGDWVPGDAVRFIAQMDRYQAATLRRRTGDTPLRVRVQGAVPTTTGAFFSRAQAPLADSAVLVQPVAAELDAGRDPAGAQPVSFDWSGSATVAAVLSTVWSLALLALVLAVQVEAWKRRRRAASIIE